MGTCVIEGSADTVLDLRCLPQHALLDDRYFATVPLISVRPRPVYTRLNETEEELHSLFEEAISERVQRISHQLSHSTSGRHPMQMRAQRVGRTPLYFTRLARSWQNWRPHIQFACLALCLLLAGFDLMGLLVLTRY